MTVRAALLGALVAGVPLPALAVTGRVVDEARRMPVAGAVVTVIGGKQKVKTDGAGRFKISPRPSKGRAGGELSIAREPLVEAKVAFAAAKDDLGDIVLKYPPRKLGVGAPAVHGAQVLFDGTRKSLDASWEMWQSPWRKAQGKTATPVLWELAKDPVDAGMVMVPNLVHHRKWYAREELVTRKRYRDFQLHIEFNVGKGANSGVYLQNRHELQVSDGGGVGDLYKEAKKTSDQYAGTDKWNAYDVTFRAARWDGTTRTKKALASVWWNGVQVHKNVEAGEVQGMDFKGEEGLGFVPSGEPVDPSDQGIKLQNHGTVVRYRNVWILELSIDKEDTDFGY